jgi:hypothetical protein
MISCYYSFQLFSPYGGVHSKLREHFPLYLLALSIYHLFTETEGTACFLARDRR